MKRILALILTMAALAAIPLSAHAEEKKIDLSGLTYDELVELKDQINLAIWECDEWQEVEVPQGVWKVGEDIPVGHWTIKAMPKGRTMVSMGTEVKNGGTDVKSKSHSTIYDVEDKGYEEGKTVSEWSIELKDGDFVQVQWGNALFTPYAGKPSLGFKK